MAVEARVELTFVVAMCAESLLEELFDQDTRFRKSIHAHINFERNTLIVDNVTQVVFLIISFGRISIFIFMYLGSGKGVLR